MALLTEPRKNCPTGPPHAFVTLMNYLDTTNKAQCKLRIFKEEMIPDYISVLPQTQMVICDVTAASFVWVSFSLWGQPRRCMSEILLYMTCSVKMCFHHCSGYRRDELLQRSFSRIFILRIISSVGVWEPAALPSWCTHAHTDSHTISWCCDDDEDGVSYNEEHVGISASVTLLLKILPRLHGRGKKPADEFLTKLTFVCLYV